MGLQSQTWLSNWVHRIQFSSVAHSCRTLCDPMEYSPWNSPCQSTGVGSHSLLQGMFPTQGSNPGLPYCRWIFYQLSHQGSPRILEYLLYFTSASGIFPLQNVIHFHFTIDWIELWSIYYAAATAAKSLHLRMLESSTFFEVFLEKICHIFFKRISESCWTM